MRHVPQMGKEDPPNSKPMGKQLNQINVLFAFNLPNMLVSNLLVGIKCKQHFFLSIKINLYHQFKNRENQWIF